MILNYASVDVGVCTYRRPSLEATIRSLAAQVLAPQIRMRVIVADNDETPSAQTLVQRLVSELALDCVYLHAPARNISVARNACLEAARAPLLAFIDDDEEASPEWLGCLIERLVQDDADVVFGPVRAVYQEGAPRWLREADLHSISPVRRPGHGLETGYTCNTLVVRDRLGDLKFDPRLGRSGGEDTVFFHEMSTRGAKLSFAPAAIVTEIVTSQRVRLNWLLKRGFRTGQTHARILQTRGNARVLDCVLAVAKVSYCAGVAGLNAFSPARRTRALIRGALHCGVVGSLLGLSDLRLY
jgi:succinoglycan biosynthesis protein ExoM